MFQGRMSCVLFAILAITVTAHAKQLQTPANPEVRPGEFVVQVQPGKLRAMSFAPALQGQIKEVIPHLNLLVVKREPSEGMRMSIQSLSNIPGVVRVEPNFVYRINRVPNDPDFTKLWGMDNQGQEIKKHKGIPGVDIGAVQAWDITTGTRDIVVAVIDTGVDYNNPDLKNNIWTNEAEFNGQTGVDDDKNGYVDDIHGYNFVKNNGNPMDDHGHGTHCSGTIGGEGDNSNTIVGVNWQVRIMGVKFLSAEGSGSLEGATKAIDYAIMNGAKVLSNSWGGGGYSKILEDVIKKSNDQGLLFVAAAGNESSDNDSDPAYPATYQVPNIISVAAVNNTGELADFSCYGAKTVHIGAPGVDVYSTLIGNPGFDYWSGTSMATPHVSGVAALVWGHEPNLTNLELKDRLLHTGRPLSGLRNKTVTGAMVNAYYALTNTTPPPDPNDPSNWDKVEMQISSVHPYPAKANIRYDVKAPEGTRKFAIHFAKFKTENRYDNVEIYNSEGQKVGNITGSHDDSYSPVILGDSAYLILTADDSVQEYGFDIDGIAIPNNGEMNVSSNRH